MTARRTPKRASYDASVIHSESVNPLWLPDARSPISSTIA